MVLVEYMAIPEDLPCLESTAYRRAIRGLQPVPSIAAWVDGSGQHTEHDVGARAQWMVAVVIMRSSSHTNTDRPAVRK